MKILYHFRVRGVGAERVHIAGISYAFKSLGHPVTFISPSSVDPTSEKVDAANSDGRKPGFSRLLHLLADNMPQFVFELMEILYNGFGFIRLFRASMKQKPDIIYERHAFYNISGALIASMLKIPLVIEVNELAGYERVRKQSFPLLAKVIESFVFNRATIVTSVSEFLTSRVKKAVTENVKLMTIPNGIDLEWSEIPKASVVKNLRRRLGICDQKVLCFVGGLVPWHNFELMLESVRRLENAIGKLRLIIVGDGPLREKLMTLSKRLLSEQNITFTGNVSHNSVREYIAASDIAIIPETNSYRSPIKMFEYMAMAKPVVAPRRPPIQSVIAEGVDGILFNPGEVNSLYEALFLLANDEQLSLRIGKMARKKVLDHYLWSHHAKKIIIALGCNL